MTELSALFSDVIAIQSSLYRMSSTSTIQCQILKDASRSFEFSGNYCFDLGFQVFPSNSLSIRVIHIAFNQIIYPLFLESLDSANYSVEFSRPLIASDVMIVIQCKPKHSNCLLRWKSEDPFILMHEIDSNNALTSANSNSSSVPHFTISCRVRHSDDLEWMLWYFIHAPLNSCDIQFREQTSVILEEIQAIEKNEQNIVYFNFPWILFDKTAKMSMDQMLYHCSEKTFAQYIQPWRRYLDGQNNVSTAPGIGLILPGTPIVSTSSITFGHYEEKVFLETVQILLLSSVNQSHLNVFQHFKARLKSYSFVSIVEKTHNKDVKDLEKWIYLSTKGLRLLFILGSRVPLSLWFKCSCESLIRRLIVCMKHEKSLLNTTWWSIDPCENQHWKPIESQHVVPCFESDQLVCAMCNS